MTRICYLHIGTPKTGTTSLQNLLAHHPEALREKEILYPLSGRDPMNSHNNIGWEQLGHRRFDPRLGTLDALSEEIARSSSGTVVVSSEILSYCYGRPDILSRIKTRLNQAGYGVRVLVVFREWVGYAESHYAESVKNDGLRCDFDTFIAEVLDTGAFRVDNRQACFEYEKIVGGFSEIFGREQVVCRAYSERTLSDCAEIFGLDVARLASGGGPHRNRSFGVLLIALLRDFNRIAYRLNFDEAARAKGLYRIADQVQKASLSGRKFSAVTPRQAREMERRFEPTRRWLNDHCGVNLVSAPSTFGPWRAFRFRLSMARHFFELRGIVDRVIRELQGEQSRPCGESGAASGAVFPGPPPALPGREAEGSGKDVP